MSFLTHSFEVLSLHPTWVQWGGSIVIAYLGGVLASLTPCIYPMIPITVSVIGANLTQTHSWKRGLQQGFLYASGIALVYAFLGLIAGLSGQIFGTLTHQSSWYLGLGILMTLAALTLLNVIHLPHYLPMFKSSNAFLLGLSTGCIASPCTTPILSGILAYIAHQQSIIFGFILMLAFAYGLSTLLILLIISTHATRFLPRSGPWMQRIQTLSGFILLAFAEYLIYHANHC